MLAQLWRYLGGEDKDRRLFVTRPIRRAVHLGRPRESGKLRPSGFRGANVVGYSLGSGTCTIPVAIGETFGVGDPVFIDSTGKARRG